MGTEGEGVIVQSESFFNQHIFKCHCGAERVYGSGPISGATFASRPRLVCLGPHSSFLQIHTFKALKAAEWVDYMQGEEIPA